jgi:hypothetical protein
MKYLKEFKDYKSEVYDQDDILYFGNLIQNTYHKKVIQVLGEGGNGIAFDLGDSVVKITDDGVEAKYAKQLQHIDSDHLVKVYDVQVVEEYSMSHMKTHMIHQEKVETKGLNDTIRTMIYHIQSVSNVLHKLKHGAEVTDADVLELYERKIFSLTEANLLHFYREIEKVFLECIKYKLPTHEISGKNIGLRDRKHLVYFDVSDPNELL